MKRINAGLLILCICFAISCTKKAPNPGSWKFGNETYAAGVAARTTNPGIALSTVSTDGYSSVLFFFNTYPTTSGTYTVVNSTTPIAGQVGIQFADGDQGSGNLYIPTGSSSPQASVTVSGGKVSISVPSVMLANQDSYYTADSALFTASINQTQ